MAKNTSTFLNDIKNYDLIRELIRHIFLYGNYSKGDLVKNKILGSERSAYDMIKRFKNYLDGEYLETHNLPTRKKDKRGYRLKYDPFLCPINYLADTYKNCAFVIEDFIFYFTILQAFKPYPTLNPYKHLHLTEHDKYDNELNVGEFYNYDTLVGNIIDILDYNKEILSKLNEINSFESIQTIFTTPKIKNRLSELVDLGIVVQRKNEYSLAPDIFLEYEDHIEELILMTTFFYNYTELCIPGYFLANTLNQYLSYINFTASKQLTFKQKNEVFFYKNSNLQNVLDNNVFWFFINAI